jgi:hypothetical protein
MEAEKYQMEKSEFSPIEEFYFRHPFTCLLAGPTFSGKTSIILKILNLLGVGLVRPCPEQVIYCYSIWQPLYDDIRANWPASGPVCSNSSSYKSELIFHKGLPPLDNFDNSKKILLILDDLMQNCSKDKGVLDIFTTNSHHLNISIIYVTQNIFSNGKNSRTISLNCQYMILTNNPRDRQQVKILGQQMFPLGRDYFFESYLDAVSIRKFGYLIIDMTQETENENRVQTGILGENERIIYRIK